MKSTWQGTAADWAAINSSDASKDMANINDYTDLLQADTDAKEWDKEDEQCIFVDSD